MVNKTLLPGVGIPSRITKPLKYKRLSNWHGFRCEQGEPRLGRAWRFIIRKAAWEGKACGSFRGEQAMENALLIGLSRQTVLERQLDVVANNIANVNTAGYKSDSSLFEEYLNTPAHEDNFVGLDRRVSFVQDRGTFRNFSQGPVEETKNPLDVAIDGSGLLAIQAPSGERYTRDGGLHITNQGQLVTVAGNPVLGTSGPITFQPTDHDINITPDGTITVVEGNTRTSSIRGKLRLVNFANPQDLQKEGLNLFTPNQGAAQADTKSVVRQGFIEKSNVNAVAEMGRMMEVTRAYTQISTLLQQQHDLQKNAIQQLADVPA
jgi:flagellar basal-body rod protein FlgF